MYLPKRWIEEERKREMEEERRQEEDGGIEERRSLRKRRETGHQCDPDSEWRDSCNVCVCTPEGVPVCTRMNCAMRARSDFNWSWGAAASIATSEAASDLRRRCSSAPFELVKKGDECNECVCNGNKLPVCTQIACGTSRETHGPAPTIIGPPGSDDFPSTSSSSSSPAEDECKPGTSWRIECKDCHCDENKRQICEEAASCGDEENEEEEQTSVKPEVIDRGT